MCLAARSTLESGVNRLRHAVTDITSWLESTQEHTKEQYEEKQRGLNAILWYSYSSFVVAIILMFSWTRGILNESRVVRSHRNPPRI
jgi:hypothetical protein